MFDRAQVVAWARSSGVLARAWGSSRRRSRVLVRGSSSKPPAAAPAASGATSPGWGRDRLARLLVSGPRSTAGRHARGAPNLLARRLREPERSPHLGAGRQPVLRGFPHSACAGRAGARGRHPGAGVSCAKPLSGRENHRRNGQPVYATPSSSLRRRRCGATWELLAQLSTALTRGALSSGSPSGAPTDAVIFALSSSSDPGHPPAKRGTEHRCDPRVAAARRGRGNARGASCAPGAHHEHGLVLATRGCDGRPGGGDPGTHHGHGVGCGPAPFACGRPKRLNLAARRTRPRSSSCGSRCSAGRPSVLRTRILDRGPRILVRRRRAVRGGT
jgi:hypothetical protein